MIRWETCRRNFEPDGALRDIYVNATGIEDWRALFEVLRRDYDLEFLVDGVPREIPATIDDIFEMRGAASPILRISAGGICVVCHFFTTDEIEFDIDPREVTSQSALDELFGFLRRVGDTLSRPVILTYEGDEHHPFISYEPSRREFKYHEC